MSRKLINFWYILLIVFGISIFYKSYVTAQKYGMDMQYFPTLQFYGKVSEHKEELKKTLEKYKIDSQFIDKNIHSLNPYNAYHKGYNHFFTQVPNYSHITYILFYPLTFFNFEEAKKYFALFNFVCFILTIFLAFKQQVPPVVIIFFSFFVLSGYTFSNVIQQGQVTIFIGLCIMAAFYFKKNSILLAFLLSLCLIKYSFGFFVLVSFFIMGYYRSIILAAILSFLYSVIYNIKFDTFNFKEIFLNVIAPLKINSTLPIGPIDLMSAFRHLEQNFFLNPYNIFIILLFIIFIVLCIKKRSSGSLVLSSQLHFSLFSIYHLGYDSYMFYISFLLLFLNFKNLTFKEFGKFIIVNKSLLILIVIVLFLYQYPRIEKYLKINVVELVNGKHFAMDMGFSFTFAIASLLCICAFSILLNFKGKE